MKSCRLCKGTQFKDDVCSFCGHRHVEELSLWEQKELEKKTVKKNILSYQIGVAECYLCEKKLEGKEGVTAYLTNNGEWHCLSCLLDNPNLLNQALSDIRRAAEWPKEKFNVIWSHYPGKLNCSRHQSCVGEGLPTQLYMANGQPLCVVCLRDLYPEVYHNFLAKLEKKQEALVSK